MEWSVCGHFEKSRRNTIQISPVGCSGVGQVNSIFMFSVSHKEKVSYEVRSLGLV